MSEDNYIRAKFNEYNDNTSEWELVCKDVFYSVIKDIVRVNLADTSIWSAEDYGEFIVLFIGIDGIESSLYVGAEGTYVFYGGVKYEGEAGINRLVPIIERDKVAKMLDRI